MAENPLFANAEAYDEMLRQGLDLSGENKSFFMKGRLQDLKKQLPAGFTPRHILDFGCGLGETTAYFSEVFPQAAIVGTDSSLNALEFARSKHRNSQIQFIPLSELSAASSFDLCYVNGVFHHIDPNQRSLVLESLCSQILSGGYLAFFENNPWNLGTRLVMRMIAFDRDAIMLNTFESKELLMAAGLRVAAPRFLFYFPRPLAWLRFLEPLAVRIPLGAQYYLLAQKP